MKSPTAKQRKNYAKYLTESEEIVSAFGIGDKYFWINASVFFPLSFILVGMPFLLKVLHLKHSKTYILTNRRLLIKDGVFNISLTSAPFNKITHITVKDKFLPRISYGIGDLIIHTAASGSLPVEIVLEKVQDPLEVKNLIEDLIVKERHITVPQQQGLVKKF
ncbi:hypothetical protein A2872_04135 [Candidatus Gottesmanbacteria bacterium RIFCSPHIGHO2_01_FULL_42_12]|uniref:YdbS-like PH domain-containing protein n=1 Tax=Candidatus Gottesmanbacteria bacterium RIFCSPHIGHO2_01_FULL_42_12 TaxID=1798377 RepID=A0A1F5Z1Y9_9BACT|nr:MAG: hypothetical protein A2872_04135 [Candidatus Gottesmanbacteria bacterium RIFCSPHIGHO2_01_FULL_42_12]